ncbi:MAG: F0F1 ATP synthase subunit delta [Candidatus Paceibacterota bacterium]
MLANDYAAALAPIIKKNEASENVLRDLDRVLALHGHQKLKKRILSALVERLTKESQRNEVVVRVAKAEHIKKYAEAIDSACKKLGTTNKPTIVIDTTLVGGFILQTQNRLLDMSYKRTLIELYRNSIKSN